MRWLLALAILMVTAGATQAANSKPFQERYCRGMVQEKYVPFGGRADCISDEYAIEVEWVKDWYQAVGQSLYYAAATGRKPGIILLCPYAASNAYGEGKCRSFVYRLAEALTLVKAKVMVWECFPEDKTLADCVRPDMSAP